MVGFLRMHADVRSLHWRVILQPRTPNSSPRPNLVGVLNTDLESARFQRSSTQITDSEPVVVRGFAETPARLAPRQGHYSYPSSDKSQEAEFVGSPLLVIIFGGAGVAHTTKNHYMNTTTHLCSHSQYRKILPGEARLEVKITARG
jgi:hypothetical protein